MAHLKLMFIALFICNIEIVMPNLAKHANQNDNTFETFKLYVSGDDKSTQKPHQNSSHGGIHLIGWDWDKNKNVWLFCLFLLMAAIAKIGYHFSNFLNNIIPESCILILLGLTIGAIVHSLQASKEVPQFTVDLFFFVLLPPIILESAYSLHDIAFLTNLGSILVFAVIGTFINIALIGPSLYLIKLLPLKWLAFPPDISFLELMVFGTAISAVDPVSVLAIFQDLSVNKSLYFIVFGESLLNDAVVIVVHRILCSMLGQTSVEGIQFLWGFISLFLVSCGGFFIGVSFGVFTSLITLKTTHVRVIEPLIVVTMAYMGFICAEIVHFSGLISLIGCGLVQSEYTFKNISKKSRTTVKYFTKTLSTISDLLIFYFLGTMLINEELEWNTAFALFSLIFCLIYRFVSVFVLTFILNNFLQRVPVIKFEEQILMAYGGLRGAVAFALIALLKSYENSGIYSLSLLKTTTLFVILFTVFILGATTKPLLNYLRIKREVKEEAQLFHLVNAKFIESIVFGVSDITGVHTFNHYWTKKLVKINEKYVKKYLTHGNNEKNIEKILQKLILKEEMEKLFGGDDKSGHFSEDKNNNHRKSISNASQLNIDSSDESSDEEPGVCHPVHQKLHKLLNRLSQFKMLSFLKHKSKTKEERIINKRRKMSQILQNAFDENERNQTLLRNSVTKGQLINRENIKQNILSQRRASRASTGDRNGSSVSRQSNTYANKIRPQLLSPTRLESSDYRRRLSLISNISNIEVIDENYKK